MSSYKLGLGSIAFLVSGVASLGCSTSSSDDGGTGGTAGSGGAGGGAPSAACAAAVADGVRTCIGAVNQAWDTCYQDSGAPCTADDSNVAAALGALETAVTEACADGEFLSLTTDALVGRVQNSCASEANSIAWRSFGGPQGAVWETATSGQQACLVEAHAQAAALVDGSLGAINDCLSGGECDAVEASRESLASDALSNITSSCTDPLEDLIAVTPETFVARAAHQVDCITATANADT